MITATKYIKPNITIETNHVGAKKFYIYNYQGVHYRVFDSLDALNAFLNSERATWCFECETESDLNLFFEPWQEQSSPRPQ